MALLSELVRDRIKGQQFSIPGPHAVSHSLVRDEGAIVGLFVGDALAMPVHWFYDTRLIGQIYGGKLTKYVAPSLKLPGSILNLSNTDGPGRGSDKGDLIGTVINHGKKKYWLRGLDHHYHCTLRCGENTLEAQITRVVMREIVASRSFNPITTREAYVKFMTTPGSHNDTNAASAHRAFFVNWAYRKLQVEDCPSNEDSNIDAIDGLTNLPVVSLLRVPEVLAATQGDRDKVMASFSNALKFVAPAESVTFPEWAADVTDCIGLARRCDGLQLPICGRAFSALLQHVIALPPVKNEHGTDVCDVKGVRSLLQSVASMFGMKLSTQCPDRVTACYIESAFPVFLEFAFKYADSALDTAMLASTNAGGENVARGAVLGALLGGAHGFKAFPSWMIDGLLAKAELEEEIDALIQLIATEGSVPASAPSLATSS